MKLLVVSKKTCNTRKCWNLISNTLYTLVDTFYAGKISPEALSALSKSFPIYFLIIATSIGVTVAGTSLIGSSIGEKNEKNILGYFTNIIHLLR